MRRWGGCATAGPGDNSRCGPTAASTPTLSLPPAGKWMSASLSPVRQRASLAGPDRGDTRGGLGLPFPSWMDGAGDVAETTYTPFQTEAGRPAGAAHRPAGWADSPVPRSPSSIGQIQLSRRLHHRPRWGDPGWPPGGRSSPPRRGRERHTRPGKVRRWAEPHAVGDASPPTAPGWRSR